MAKKKSAREIHLKKINALLRDETSLISISKDFRKKVMPDMRKTMQEIEEEEIDFEFARKILEDVLHEYIPDREDLSRVAFTLRDRGNNEFMEISFGVMRDTDSWGNLVNEEWEDFVRLPIVFYIAATYEKFTLETIQNHVKELDVLVNEFDFSFRERDYLSVIKKYNKKLPDDVKLWLELNY
jgi:hypothetical protein